MNEYTKNKLLNLNRQFYQTFARQFSATRQRLQPGVRQIIHSLSSLVHLLELGCGNGELNRELYRMGFQGTYVGLDFSPLMLAEAEAALPAGTHHGFSSARLDSLFLHADLSSPGWDKALPAKPFNTVLAFSVLHHLPGHDLRHRVLEQVRGLLTPRGRFIHSEWQFLNSPRLLARLQPWDLVGIDPAELEQGDYLLDWRDGGTGLRYVHYFNEPELQRLAQETGFQVIKTFYSDGKEGNLGLYQEWKLKIGMPLSDSA